jgi:hypothetical protein
MMENGIFVPLILFKNVTWKLSPLRTATSAVAIVAGFAFWYKRLRAIKRLHDLLTAQELQALRVEPTLSSMHLVYCHYRRKPFLEITSNEPSHATRIIRIPIE